MKRALVSQNNVDHIGDIVSASLSWDGREIDFASIERIEMRQSWAGARRVARGTVIMTDHSEFRFEDSEWETLLLTGKITLRVASLEICFDIKSISKIDYPVD